MSHKKAQTRTTQITTAILACFISFIFCVNSVAGNGRTLLPESTIAALATEISGETAKRNLEFIARRHRMRGSRGFRAAAEHIVEQLRSYGLKDARIEQFPAGAVLNLVDGRRTVQEVRDAVSATYGPIPVESVFEYLHALESIRVIERLK